MSYDKPTTSLTPAPAVAKDAPHAPSNRGFTLIELLAVMAILAALILIAIPSYSHFKDLARQVRAMEEIRGIEKAVISYSIDKGGVYPPNLDALGLGPQNDPWGRSYVYYPIVPGGPMRLGLFGVMTPLNDDFDLFSTGVDGLTDPDISNPVSLDDIVRSGDGGFVGIDADLLLTTE